MVYFLIGSSVLKANEETWRRIQQEAGVAATNGANGSGRPLTFEKEKFNMGNLDFLWFMENQLSKLDIQIESNLKKIEKQVEELDKTHKGFQIETREDGRKPIETYIYNFKWDDTRFPRTNLNEVYKNMNHRALVVEAEFRNKTQTYNDKKNALNQLTKKEGSTFVTRDLVDVLKKPLVDERDFVYSEYLTTGVIVVPKAKIPLFQLECESLSDLIVPNTLK
jgi:V-type H+-transporting ATPase subunit C